MRALRRGDEIMGKTAGRRDLRFATLEAILDDVETLQQQGYRSLGNWTLGQTCAHLTIFLKGATDGFGKPAPWLLRTFVAPPILRRILREEAMPEGIKVPTELLPGPSSDDTSQIAAFKDASARFRSIAGTPSPHPFFGKITRAQWEQLHRIHSAHHLSFLVPNGSS